MPTLIAFYVLALGAAIVWVVYRDFRRGEVELVSVRNLALLGFLYFQVWSVFLPLTTGETLFYRIDHMATTGLIYAAMATVFLIVFFYSYRRGWIVNWLARKTPVARREPAEAILWVAAFALAPIAVGMKLSATVPLIGILLAYASDSIAAMSAGIAGWIWARRPMNLLAAAMMSVLFVVNSIIATIGVFGRRPLIGVGLCMLWCMYFAAWRYQPFRRWLPKICIIGMVPLIAMIAYSSIRAKQGVTDSVGSLVGELQRSSDILGMAKEMTFVDTGPISLWLIETHPERFEPRPLFSLYYTFLNPVPRQWWREKPWPLGLELTRMASIRNVSEEANLGPGIIGHAAAEGGWYALIIYAILGALMLRYVDQLAGKALRNPLIMAPLGSSLGQVVALPRGEASLFTFIFIYGTSITFVIMLVFSWLTGSMRAPAAPMVANVEEEEQHEPEHVEAPADYSDYGDFSQYGEDEAEGEHAA